MINEQLKNIIANEIAALLQRTEAIPQQIKIEVHYEHSLARLTVDEDRIKRLSQSKNAGQQI